MRAWRGSNTSARVILFGQHTDPVAHARCSPPTASSADGVAEAARIAGEPMRIGHRGLFIGCVPGRSIRA